MKWFKKFTLFDESLPPSIATDNTGEIIKEQKPNDFCMNPNCRDKATKDYNGHGYWVCDYHFDKLSDEFDEEYR